MALEWAVVASLLVALLVAPDRLAREPCRDDVRRDAVEKDEACDVGDVILCSLSELWENWELSEVGEKDEEEVVCTDNDWVAVLVLIALLGVLSDFELLLLLSITLASFSVSGKVTSSLQMTSNSSYSESAEKGTFPNSKQ